MSLVNKNILAILLESIPIRKQITFDKNVCVACQLWFVIILWLVTVEYRVDLFELIFFPLKLIIYEFVSWWPEQIFVLVRFPFCVEYFSG